MDARTSCLRWHRPHKVFPWLGVPLPQPETHCGVMLGRVQGPLIQESDVSDASESITSASTKAGPSHSLGLGRWQCKVLAGGKLSWGSSALSSPSQNKAGKPLDGHWRRQWRRGWWDTGSCQVLGLCRRTHCTCSLAHATVPVDERDACSAYDLKHEPISWWGDSTAPPGYFTLNTAKGRVLPLCFHSAALKEGVIGLPLVWQMGVKANPAFPMELDLKQSVGFFSCELQFLTVWHSVMSEGICLPLSVSLALSAELTVTEWGKQALGCIGPTEILQMCCLI